MRRAWPGVALVGCGAGFILAIAGGLRLHSPNGAPGWLPPDDTIAYVGWFFAAALFYAGAVALALYRALPRWGLGAVVAFAVLARGLALVQPPALSTDIFRYVWDGRVQNAGISPYRYLPADPALASLRDPGPPERPGAVFTNINRADTAPTIYPPFAQILFATIDRVAPGIWGVKAAMAGFDLLTLAVLVLLLRAGGLPGVRAVVWAWNPLVVWEFANEGHIDAAAHAFVALALLAAVRGWRGRAGAALAAAALFKLLPITLFPAIWRRWDWRGPLVAAGMIAAAYAAYAASAGMRVFGYLGGYTHEEGTFSERFVWLRLGAVVLLGVAGAVFAFGRPLPALAAERVRTVCRQALVLTALLLAAISPKYPWYYTALLVPGTVVPAWCVLWVCASAPLLYAYDFPDSGAWIVGPAAVLLVVDFFLARLTSRKGAPPDRPC